MRKYACLYLFFHFDSILNNFQDIDVGEREERRNERRKETLVREKKEEMKRKALSDERFVCVNFDLQQVLHLPVSKRNELFYKREDLHATISRYTIWEVGLATAISGTRA